MLQQMHQGLVDPWQSEPIAPQELPKALVEAASADDTTSFSTQETTMPRGDKSAYTDKQKRQAEHIEEGYEKRGTPEHEAKARAWATVNAMTHGGKKSGSGRGQPEDHSAAQKGGKVGGPKGGKASGHASTSSSKS
jgi:plasmid stabilization system protein ParE